MTTELVEIKQTGAKRVFAGAPGPGRPPGSANKTTTLLKDAVLKAATLAGGKDGLVGYLQQQAKANPAHFMSLLGKVLPLQLAAEDGASVVIQIVQFTAVEPQPGETERMDSGRDE